MIWGIIFGAVGGILFTLAVIFFWLARLLKGWTW